MVGEERWMDESDGGFTTLASHGKSFLLMDMQAL